MALPHSRNVGDTLRRQCATRPDAVAFETPSRRWTFAEANDAVNRLANVLASLGISRGDRIANLTRHGAECTLLILAAARIGAVCAPLNWRLAPPEIEYVLRNPSGKLLKRVLRQPYWDAQPRQVG